MTFYTFSTFDSEIDTGFNFVSRMVIRAWGSKLAADEAQPWGDGLFLNGREGSSYRGGVPGFTVFDQLWFNDGHFRMSPIHGM